MCISIVVVVVFVVCGVVGSVMRVDLVSGCGCGVNVYDGGGMVVKVTVWHVHVSHSDCSKWHHLMPLADAPMPFCC